MARKSRWEDGEFKDGVMEVKLLSWKYFSDYINQEMLDFPGYVYRGHGNAAWKLEPALDRIVKSPTSPKRDIILRNFQFETRGRRGTNPPKMEEENDWWALGQHHGLLTPLLDWSESPFVALFFAAFSAREKKSKSLAIFALHYRSIEDKNTYILNNDELELVNKQKPTVKIIRPLSDENSRLVNQRGLFTRGPNNVDLESWIKKYPQKNDGVWELIKITIPNQGMQDCLRYLNRMNINHSTLFPDLYGASEFCNQKLKTRAY